MDLPTIEMKLRELIALVIFVATLVAVIAVEDASSYLDEDEFDVESAKINYGKSNSFLGLTKTNYLFD